MSKQRLNGTVNYQSGRARVEADVCKKEAAQQKNDMRYLSVLDAAVCVVLGVAKTADCAPIDVFETDSRLRNYLRAKGKSAGYIRNVLSYFHRVVRHADHVNVRSPALEQWESMLAELDKDALGGIKAWSKTQSYMVAFVCAGNVVLESGTNGDRIIQDFGRFLIEKRGLSPIGNVKAHKRGLRQVLTLMGLSFAPPQSKPIFDTVIESEFLQMGRYAVGGRQERQTTPGKRALFAVEGEKIERCVRPVTWDRTERGTRGFLNWLRVKDSVVFERGNFATYLSDANLRLWLLEVDETDRHTEATADTLIESVTRVLRYAFSLRLRGFEKMSQAELDKVLEQMWFHYKHTTQKLLKPSINARLRKSGSLPVYRDIYEYFMLRLEDKIKFLVQEVAVLESRPSQRGDSTRWATVCRRGRSLAMAMFLLNLSMRTNDVFQNIAVTDLSRQKELFLVAYLPTKTDWHKDPPDVLACMAPWFTPYIEFYLKKIQPRISPDSALLFPKIGTGENSVLRGNRYEKITRITREYFGVSIGTSNLRKVMATAFNEYGLAHLNQFQGHKEDFMCQQKLTKMERDNYLILVAPGVANRDRRLFAQLWECMNIVLKKRVA